MPNKCIGQQTNKLEKPAYGPLFNNRRDSETKSSSDKLINNSSNFNSRKNSKNNASNESSQNDLSKHMNTNELNPPKHINMKPHKARAYSTPNEEIFNLLSLPFLEEDDYKKTNQLDKFEYKVKQSKSYKEVGSQALQEIEAFEKLLSDKFICEIPNSRLK